MSHAYPPVSVYQAVAARHGDAEIRWRSTSPNLPDAWKERLEELIRLFGPRPAGVQCPEAMFVLPFDSGNVVVARVADLDAVEGQTPNVLGFHLVILPAEHYGNWGGDPFALLAALPPAWEQRQPLAESITLPMPIRRTSEEVCTVLKRADSPVFLGGTQAILDGGRIAWKRQVPGTDLLQALWLLLPYSTRRELAIASFSFNPELDFQAVVAPAEVASRLDARYISEAQAEHYPEGHYELGLQIAAEKGDQGALDGLFARRSRRETMRLGLWLLIGLILAASVIGLFKLLG